MKLICPECRRENEPERIYCHDCGARLDRSAVYKQKAKEEDPLETQKRVAAMFDARGVKARLWFFRGAKLILAALVAGAVVQMLRAPDLERPKASPDSFPPQINLDLEDATMDPPRHGPMRYTDEQANQYLAYVLKSKHAALSKYLQFESMVVGFDENSFHFSVERSLFGYSLYTSATYSARIEKSNIVMDNHGGHLGRLPIHPALMKYGGFLFADVRQALERERKLVAKLASVEFHPKLIILTPKPPSA